MVYEITLPIRIQRLSELAHNMWWSWHGSSRAVFRSLDYALWSMSGHNPAKMLAEIDPQRLQSAATDPAFLQLYDAAIREMDDDLHHHVSWYTQEHSGILEHRIAYFSAEFAIHNSLPIYAGGLGILAGDILKEASDLGVPLVGVGLMYPHGYFWQQIGPDGWQQELYKLLDFDRSALSPVRPAPDGRPAPIASVPIGNRNVNVGAFLVRVGRVELYLVSTDVEGNPPEDRGLTGRLYSSEQGQRIQQEIVLGIGGVRVLQALGIRPMYWHANEGHTAFMMFERLRAAVEHGSTFEHALAKVRRHTAFTTHTPVPAGHDVFSFHLMDEYLSGFWLLSGVNREEFVELGRPTVGRDEFNMTVLALRTSGVRNAVSALHGKVTRRMWHSLWPHVAEEEVPIIHITNGVHLPTWLAAEIAELYDQYLAPDWISRHDDPRIWELVDRIPDEELWMVRRRLKHRLITAMTLRARECWASGRCSAEQALAMGGLFERDTLTIGFVRRFTEYKRPALLFHDVDRLKRILWNDWRPVQFVFAGKSHPADDASKQLLQRTFQMALDRDFHGRIAFVEDYDMHMARLLTRGVDVWLNTPRRPREASGTSGMKASMNGVLHLSVPDGWWPESYNGTNGWVINDQTGPETPAEEDARDAAALYTLLESEIVPTFYDQGRNGVPHAWLAHVKDAMRTVSPQFSSRRMVKEYVERMYSPALEGEPPL